MERLRRMCQVGVRFIQVQTQPLVALVTVGDVSPLLAGAVEPRRCFG